MPRKQFLINTAPGSWVIRESKILDGNSMFNAFKIYRITYGAYIIPGSQSKEYGKSRGPATCFMRDSVYRSLVNGDLRLLPQDNETGFVVVDSRTGLATPRIKAGKYLIL